MKPFCCLMFVFLVSVPSRADIILSVVDADITSGGSGFADVLIRSTGVDNLSSFDLSFSITNLGGPVGALQFSNPQTLTDAAEANYVFEGLSGGVAANVSTPTTMSQSDFHSGFGDVSIGATDLLLVRLDLEHVLPGITPLASAVGDQFTISVTGVPLLFDSGFGSPDIDSFTSGTVTITASAAAVPEPSTCGLLFVGTCIIRLCRWRRQRD